MGPAARTILLAALGMLLGACSSWQRIETRDQWTLYAKPGEKLDAERFERALIPAFVAVESKLGPFERRVRVHAWNEVPSDSEAPNLSSEGAERIENVPGIGQARVRAYHVTGGATPFATNGVFLGTWEVGTVVHELVHARLAESASNFPLWFEEGLASLLGDGACYEGEWIFDGLACWPARVLREESISDEELRRVMQLGASDKCSARDNLLVHFVGWAVIFDLARELPDADAKTWLAHFRAACERRGLLVETRERIARSTAKETIASWLERLKDPSPGVRLAAAKGLWKLRSQAAIDALVSAMQDETETEVRCAMGLNALLSVGEMRVGRRTWRDVWRKVVPSLGELVLEDENERPSLAQFLAGLRGRGGRTQAGLDGLARYWEE